MLSYPLHKSLRSGKASKDNATIKNLKYCGTEFTRRRSAPNYLDPWKGLCPQLIRMRAKVYDAPQHAQLYLSLEGTLSLTHQNAD
jgi:hypothetical protein